MTTATNGRGMNFHEVDEEEEEGALFFKFILGGN